MSHQQPPAGWGPPPGTEGGPPPRRKGNAGKIIGFSCLGAVLLVVALIVAITLVARDGDGGGDGDPERRTPVPRSPSGRPQEESGARGDAKITTCEVDPVTKWAAAELLVTNRSSKASDYIVHVEFVDASGTRLSETYASTNDVAPGQQSKVTAQGLDQVTAKITCRIKDVTRYAS
ncbi:hypothetical protein GPZ77_28895 [Streptomyces sp. QHH-9511]|uniref:FxLYD domain-containing protein n=1 Tax=Streptomyces sp. QHH-9511 TaxID=2684468 RepID=UPI001319B185|nr:FxLYD domain-containing protein [Streptomyces sp. QHH-9511]QGZ51860.1 hypothetical protein GPZ77_28895 [Streptomyces sp. QHH-9511]